ncbi:MAG TPA: hypothetical protein P5191_02130 [Ruminococcus sp.]|nr:hypothetical protein [Ruminococcus sp.]
MYIPEIPNNSLNSSIKQIVKLSEKLCNDYSFEYAPPLSKKEIKKIEEFNFSLPESYKEWLSFTSCAEICGSIAHFYDIRNATSNSLLSYNDTIIIGDIIGDGEVICISKSSKIIFTENHGVIYEVDDLNEILDEIIEQLLCKL